VVLITGYLPELLAPPPEPAGRTAATGTKEPTQQPLRFEFDTILRTPPTPVTVQEPGTDVAIGLTPDGTAAGAAATDPAGTSSATAATESATPGVLDGPGTVATASMPLAADPGTRPRTPQRNGEAPVSIVERPTGAGQAAQPTPPPAPAENAPAAAASYMLQAASFRSRADADRLRAELLLLDLPATTGEVNVGGSVWYRVTVGPFPDQPSVDVARDRLRERNLTAIPFRR
jgi:cell division protein FtsN